MKLVFKRNFFHTLILLLLLFSVGFLYIRNLSSDVYAGDSGDLITAATVFGIPHPPGYPLFTFLGFLLTRLPFVSTPAFKVGLLSVLSSLGSIFIIYRYSFRVSKSILVSLLTSLILVFSFLFWFYSEIAEVFTLNTLFTVLLFYLAILFYEEKKKKYLYGLAFFLGLSLSHHHTILLLFPAIFYLILKRKNILLKDKKYIGVILLFFLGLLPYIYIPISGYTKPAINWLGDVTVNNFINLVTRKVYGTFYAGAFEYLSFYDRLYFLKHYVIKIVSSLTIPVFCLIIVGIWHLFVKNRRECIAIILAIFIAGPAFSMYAGFPILDKFSLGTVERFYLQSLALFFFFLPYGFMRIQIFFKRVFLNKFSSRLAILPFFIVPILLFKINFSRTDFSRIKVGENLARDIFSNISQNSALALAGDTVAFNSWYYHYALGKRSDVEIIVPELSIHVSAGGNYFFDKERKEFERNNPNLKNTFGNVLWEINKKRDVFAIDPPEIATAGAEWLPIGFVYKLIDKNSIPSEEKYTQIVDRNLKDIHPPLEIANGKLALSDIQVTYSNVHLNIGVFLNRQFKNTKKAIEYFHKALSINKKNSNAYLELGYTQLVALHDCRKSVKNFKKAIENSPREEKYYLYLYNAYKNCNYDKKIKKDLKKAFTVLFSDDIDEAVKDIEQRFEK